MAIRYNTQLGKYTALDSDTLTQLETENAVVYILDTGITQVYSGGSWYNITDDAVSVVISELPVGDNNIGNVDVVTLPSIPAGTDLIGKVSIDQVTANANEVVVKSSIPAGTNNIGDVDIVTMPDVTLNPLPAGTNNIGDVDIVTLPVLPAGDNNIGNVDVVTMPSVTLNELPAGTNNIGDVDVLTLPAIPTGSNIVGKVGIDQTTDGTTNKVRANNPTHDDLNVNANVQMADTDVSSSNPLNASSGGDVVEVQKTRPSNTTAYTALDVVGTDGATNYEFANVIGKSADTVVITGAYLRINTASLPAGMTTFRLHLYNSAPTALVDNVAFDVIDADRSKYLGYITLPQVAELGANFLWSQVDNVNLIRKITGTSIFAVLQTTGAYTPSSATVSEVGLCVIGR